jgi:hypothetical protein
MAGQQIDKLADSIETPEERQQRKRRLLKGPTEFRIFAEISPNRRVDPSSAMHHESPRRV